MARFNPTWFGYHLTKYKNNKETTCNSCLFSGRKSWKNNIQRCWKTFTKGLKQIGGGNNGVTTIIRLNSGRSKDSLHHWGSPRLDRTVRSHKRYGSRSKCIVGKRAPNHLSKHRPGKQGGALKTLLSIFESFLCFVCMGCSGTTLECNNFSLQLMRGCLVANCSIYKHS